MERTAGFPLMGPIMHFADHRGIAASKHGHGAGAKPACLAVADGLADDLAPLCTLYRRRQFEEIDRRRSLSVRRQLPLLLRLVEAMTKRRLSGCSAMAWQLGSRVCARFTPNANYSLLGRPRWI
jgi:hypothetical protein